LSFPLSQLTTPITTDGWRAILLSALQGLGPVTPNGLGGGSSQVGTGAISLSGPPTLAVPYAKIQIVTAGEPGAAGFQYTLNGSVSSPAWSATITVPTSPFTFVLPTTGTTITFAAGPNGAGTSFQVGDVFSFALAVSPLSVTSWQVGSVLRTLVDVEAQSLSALSPLVAALASGGLTSTSTGAWLDLLASANYQLTRNAATATLGSVTLTVSSGAGPYTVTAGNMTFADSAGHVFSNVGAITLPAGPGAVVVPIAAGSPGSAYNSALPSISYIQAGTLPGVTVGSGVVTAGGNDAESDAALVSRCNARWPSLGQSAPTAAVIDLWAKIADPSVTRTLVMVDPAIAARVNLFVASSAGGTTAAAVGNVIAYLAPRTPMVGTVNVQSATSSVMTIAGAVNYFSAKTTLTAVQAAVQAALAAYVQAAPLGIDAGGTVKVYWSEIEAACGSVAGVRDVTMTLNAGTANVALTTGQVAGLPTSSPFAGITYNAVLA
jgi:hypothetical protein